MASHRHASRLPPVRRLAAQAMGERHNPLLALINRNDGLARCPIQSDGHDQPRPHDRDGRPSGRESKTSILG